MNAEERATCSHLHIHFNSGFDIDELLREWWECAECLEPFVPKSELKATEAQARIEELGKAAEHFRGLTPSTIGYYSQDKGFERDAVVEEIEKLMEDVG